LRSVDEKPVEDLIFLRTVPFLRRLGPHDLSLFTPLALHEDHPAGGTLCTQGEPARRVFFVVQGELEAKTADGTYTLGPGGTVGLHHVLSRIRYPYTVTARTDSACLVLDRDPLEELFEEHFSIAWELLQQLGRELVQHGRGQPTEALFPRHSAVVVGPGQSAARSVVERMIFLLDTPLFAGSPSRAIAELARRSTSVELAAGTQLWRQGERARHFLVLQSGAVDVELDGCAPVVCGAGSAPGAVELLARERRWYDARTQSAVRALRIERDGFVDALEDHHELMVAQLEHLARAAIATRTGHEAPARVSLTGFRASRTTRSPEAS
jgi:CRP-like cAMP-binding protein